MEKRYDKITIRVNNILEKLLISIQDKLKSLDEELMDVAMNTIKDEDRVYNTFYYDELNLRDTFKEKILRSEDYIECDKAREDYQILLNFIIDSISGIKNDYLLYDFRFINNFLKEYNFSIIERLDTMFFIMMSNLRKYDIDNSLQVIYSSYKLQDMELKHFTYDEMFDILQNQNISKVYDSIKDEEKKKELGMIVNSLSENLGDNFMNQQDFVDSYLDGIDNIDSLKKMTSSLEKLGLEKSDTEPIEKYYSKRLVKEDNFFNNESYSSLDNYKDKENLKTLLREELNKYLDSKDLLPIRFLSFDELEKVFKILKTLNIISDELINSICFNNEALLSKLSIKEKYEYYRKLLDKYCEEYGLLKDNKDLNDYYKEYLICEEDEDKKFYSNEMNNNMKLMLSYVPSVKEYIKETI